MKQEIGKAAGVLWEYLHENGEASPATITRNTGLPPILVQRAIGWLGREDKIAIEKTGRTERVRLNSPPGIEAS